LLQKSDVKQHENLQQTEVVQKTSGNSHDTAAIAFSKTVNWDLKQIKRS